MEPLFVRKLLPHRTIEDFTIIHRNRRKMFLNKTGTLVWKLLEQPTPLSSIAQKIAASYRPGSVPDSAVSADVGRFAEDLYGKGLLLKDGQECPPSLPAPAPESSAGYAEKSRVAGLGGKPVIHSVQEECMTPQIDKEARSIADVIEQLYWRHFYIFKMHMELTYRCNFRCVHCYNTTHKGAEKEMNLEEWDRTLKQLAELGCYLLTFTGGEVFVRKDALEILRLAGNRGFTFRISTNGSLIDEKIVRQLEEIRPFLQGIDVSFYGADSQAHDTLSHSSGAHEKTLKAVRMLAEAKMGVLAKFITMRGNFEGIPEFENTMRKYGIKYAISTESLIPRTDGNTSPLMQLLTDEQYKQLLATQNVAAGAGASQACKPGHVRGAITPDGFVSPCEWLTDMKLGNLREKPLQEIWYGEGFRAFRKVFEQSSECPTCTLRSGCRRCPAHSYLETGNLLSCAPLQRHNAELFLANRTVPA